MANIFPFAIPVHRQALSLSLSLIGMKPKKKKKKEIIIIWFYKTNTAKNILLNLEIKETQIFIK